MIIFVDAYNLLKTVDDREQMLHNQGWYLKRLERYAAKKGHELKLVFDGGFWDHPYQEKHKHVTHIFAGRSKSADEVIKGYLNEYATKEVLLITADRELVDYAQRCRIESLRPQVFMRYIDQALQKQIKPLPIDSDIQKFTDESSPELDELMREGSKKILVKEDVEEQDLKETQKKPSKKTVRRQRILNKL